MSDDSLQESERYLKHETEKDHHPWPVASLPGRSWMGSIPQHNCQPSGRSRLNLPDRLVQVGLHICRNRLRSNQMLSVRLELLLPVWSLGSTGRLHGLHDVHWLPIRYQNTGYQQADSEHSLEVDRLFSDQNLWCPTRTNLFE